MPNIIELLKKGKIFANLSKYHLKNEDNEEVYRLYTIINEKINNYYNDEVLKEYKEERGKVLNYILEELVHVVRTNRSFMINDITMDYLLHKINSLTPLQFANNFRFFVNQTSINRGNNFYSVNTFIKYLFERVGNDQEFFEIIQRDSIFSLIYRKYLEGLSILKELDNEKIIEMFVMLISLIWEKGIFIDDNDFILDTAVYLYNNYEEILYNAKEDELMGEESICDGYEKILEYLLAQKQKRMK